VFSPSMGIFWPVSTMGGARYVPCRATLVARRHSFATLLKCQWRPIQHRETRFHGFVIT
jgi:hypothetical protein